MGSRSKGAYPAFAPTETDTEAALSCDEGSVQAFGGTRGVDTYVLVEPWNKIHFGL